MYDISQLNDMLVPELQDIAIQQNINPRKLDKQELISKILDKQSVMNNVENSNVEGQKIDGQKPKRKRKPIGETVSKAQQEPEVAEEKPKPEVKAKKAEPSIEKKKFIKKPIEDEDEEEEDES